MHTPLLKIILIPVCLVGLFLTAAPGYASLPFENPDQQIDVDELFRQALRLGREGRFDEASRDYGGGPTAGTQFELDSYPFFSERFYAYLNAGYSAPPSGTILFRGHVRYEREEYQPDVFGNRFILYFRLEQRIYRKY
jgi:hypothetical protein